MINGEKSLIQIPKTHDILM